MERNTVKELNDAIIEAAFRDEFYPGRKLKNIEHKMQEVPMCGISKFEMATFMAMQGLCQYSTMQPHPMLIEGIASYALKIAATTIKALEVERKRLFPVNENTDDDLPF